MLADERLLEGAGFEGALELLAEVADGAVLCSHGDVIPETLDALVRRGMQVKTTPDWRKGTVWVLKRNDGTDHERHRVAAPVLIDLKRLGSDTQAFRSGRGGADVGGERLDQVGDLARRVARLARLDVRQRRRRHPRGTGTRRSP